MHKPLTVWIDVERGELTDDWILVTENGWGYLAAYCATTPNLRQQPVSPEQRIAESRYDITVEDLDIIDESNESYLSDAGVPSPPRNHLWFIRRPRGLRDNEFWRAVTGAVNAEWPADNHPRGITPVMIRAVAELYAERQATPGSPRDDQS